MNGLENLLGEMGLTTFGDRSRTAAQMRPPRAPFALYTALLWRQLAGCSYVGDALHDSGDFT